MKLIESKAEYIPQKKGLEGIYKQIELAGRTAYHSQDKITPDSAKGFVDRMIKSNHGAALEHGTVYLAIPITTHYSGDAGIYIDSPYCKVTESKGFKFKDIYGDAVDCWCITTNLRFIQENALWDDVKELLCSPTEFHEKRYTMRFTCSRAIAQELTRHRVFSFLMESQRYINYSKERHGGEITFIKPTWLNCPFEEVTESELCYLANQYPQEVAGRRFLTSLSESEYAYMTLLQKGCTPQQARDVLPNATKTELIMTGFTSDWKHVIDLRLSGKTGAPHPDMVDLMQKAQKTMQEAGIWNDIISKSSKLSNMENLVESFKQKYGEGIEIEVPNPVMTIKDNYLSPFSSGSNGYITKLRINPTTHNFEYYHDWWNCDWKSEKKYTRQVCKALRQVI